ncbi:reverse transcriptase domain-containing protein [Tanacetum coccineum]|uniref:Reverse transcriptase domain-containing protein n=1 Tax=Tanacetum coccineum TaxID=301880 RepID=A0ABQ4WRR5_9ASTR
MTRSSTNELFTPYKEPEREFRSSRRHFKTLSLDELRSSDFNLLSDQEYSKEEAEAMAKTMEQYMSKTRTNYGSGVARPKIDNKDQFELKGKFLKELRENTFSGSDNEDANEHIEKVLEIVDLFHVPNITEDLKTKFLNKYCPPGRTAKKMEKNNNFQQEPDETLFQAWERFKELLMKCPQHYLTEMHEVILFYNGLDIPTRQILDSRARYYRKEDLEAYQAQLKQTRSQVKLFLSDTTTTIEADSHLIRRIGSPQYAVSDGQNKEEEGIYGPKFTEAYAATRLDDSIPQKEKDPRSFTLPCYINNVCFEYALADLGASVSVMPLLTYLNLGLGELAHTKLTVELADRTVKYPNEIPKNILVVLGFQLEVLERLKADSTNLASYLSQSCLMLTLEGFPFITVNTKEYHSECSGNYHKDNT